MTITLGEWDINWKIQSFFSCLVAAFALVAISASPASAQTIVSENFQDGTYTSGPSSTDLHYYYSATSGLAIVADPTLNPSGNNDVLESLGAGYDAGVGTVALLPSTLTLTTSNSITLSLNFRLLTDTAGNNLRLGLFNNAGTPVIANGYGNVASGTSPSTDDVGLWINYSAVSLTPSGGTINFAAENAGTGGIFGGANRDFLSFSGGTSANSFTPDTNAHQLTLTYTEPTAGTYDISYSLDGGSIYTGSTTYLSTTFNPNEFAFEGGADSVEFSDVIVTVAPEPGIFWLLALGLISLGYFRRRLGAHF